MGALKEDHDAVPVPTARRLVPVSLLLVSGTGTGVGKTVVTAALAATARAAGRTVSVVKVAQTGVQPGEAGDLAEIARLSGLDAAAMHEPARYAAALSPAAAARLEGRAGPSLPQVQALVRGLTGDSDLVLVEGAGGLLVQYDRSGWTLADLALGLTAPVLLVVDPGLGALNHTALSMEALTRRDLTCAGVVLGSWPVEPDQPDLAARSNIADLELIAGHPLAGALAAGSGRLEQDAFLVAAEAGLGPALGGWFDAADFRRIQGLAPGA